MARTPLVSIRSAPGAAGAYESLDAVTAQAVPSASTASDRPLSPSADAVESTGNGRTRALRLSPQSMRLYERSPTLVPQPRAAADPVPVSASEPAAASASPIKDEDRSTQDDGGLTVLMEAQLILACAIGAIRSAQQAGSAVQREVAGQAVGGAGGGAVADVRRSTVPSQCAESERQLRAVLRRCEALIDAQGAGAEPPAHVSMPTLLLQCLASTIGGNSMAP